MGAIQFIDSFGAWDDLGEVVPIHEQWVQLPRFSNSSNSLTRLIFGGDVENAQSFAYLRCIYVADGIRLVAPWVRIYPKLDNEYINYPIPTSLVGIENQIDRFVEIQKRHFYRRYNGFHRDTLWSVRVQIYNREYLEDPINPEDELLILGLL